MTPHTPLVEALKEDARWLRENLPVRFPMIDFSEIAGRIEEAALRIATETTEPDAAQSIRAEALEDASDEGRKLITEIIAAFEPIFDGTAQEAAGDCMYHLEQSGLKIMRVIPATAIRSLGDRG